MDLSGMNPKLQVKRLSITPWRIATECHHFKHKNTIAPRSNPEYETFQKPSFRKRLKMQYLAMSGK